jgi:3-oxoacyl-(acyl-carrier-protein) synthase
MTAERSADRAPNSEALQPSHRVFIVGASAVLPYRSSEDNHVIGSRDLETVVFNRADSLIGKMPLRRRDRGYPHDGGMIGNFFAAENAEGLIQLLRSVMPAAEEIGWRPRRTRSPEEALAVAVVFRALEEAGIRRDCFDESTPWLPKDEEDSQPLNVAIGVANSVPPLDVLATLAREGFLTKTGDVDRRKMLRLRGALSGMTGVAIRDSLRSQGSPVLEQTGCSGALFTTGRVYDHLRSGNDDLGLSGGFEIGSDPLMLYLLSCSGTVVDYETFADKPTEASRPGDCNPAGLAITEGGCCLVLATERTIRRLRIPQEQIQAEVLGWAGGQDWARLAPPDPPVEMPRVISAALQRAGVTYSDIQVAIFHGTGTLAGEVHDGKSARMAFALPMRDFKDGPDGTRPGYPQTTLPKSRTGHNLAGSGGLSIMTMMDIFRRGEIPPTRNVTQPNGLVINLVHGQGQMLEEGGRLRGMVCAVGMDGTVASVVLGEPPKEIPDYP